MNNAEFQVWYKLDTSEMPSDLAARYTKPDGTLPEFLAVSHLYSLEDAHAALEDVRTSGAIYWIKEVAA